MGQVYYKLIYHAVWTIYLREPLITMDIERALYPFLEDKVRELHGYAYAIGGVQDHVHAVLTIPPTISVSEMIGKLKGGSSHFLNKELHATVEFAWQGGYGVTSVAPYHLQKMINYVMHQKGHHRSGHLFDEFEQTQPAISTVTPCKGGRV